MQSRSFLLSIKKISNHLKVFSKLCFISHFRVAGIICFNILVKYTYSIIYTMFPVWNGIFHADSRTFRLAKLVNSNADNDISLILWPYHSSDIGIILRCTLLQNIESTSRILQKPFYGNFPINVREKCNSLATAIFFHAFYICIHIYNIYLLGCISSIWHGKFLSTFFYYIICYSH